MRRNILIALIIIAVVFLLIYLNKEYSSTIVLDYNGGEVVHTSREVTGIESAVIISGSYNFV